jgi:hypothetical protein
MFPIPVVAKTPLPHLPSQTVLTFLVTDQSNQPIDQASVPVYETYFHKTDWRSECDV